MDIVQYLSFGLLGLAGIVLSLREDERFSGFIHLLMLFGVGLYILPDLDDSGALLMYVLFALLSANFIASQLLPSYFKDPFIRLIIPAASIAGFFLVFKGDSLTYLGGEYAVFNKFIAIAAVIAIVGYELAQLIVKSFHKLLGGFEDDEIIQPIILLFKGIWIFLGMFSTSSFGVFLIASIFLLTTFFRRENDKHLSISLLAIVGFNHLIELSDVNSANILNGDVLAGIFIGAFGYYLLKLLFYASNRSIAAIAVSYVLVLLIATGVLLLGGQFQLMGGMDAFIGVLLGMSVVNAIIGKGYIGVSLLSFLLIIGSVVPPLMVNEEQQAFEEAFMEETIEKPGATDIQVVDSDGLNTIVGSYKLVADSSIVRFALGPQKETKGAFKKVNGEITITEDIQNSTFDINLSLSDFTTFNKFRDESLMGEDYFKANKYPGMSFKGKGLTLKEGNVYEILGEFTMLGVSKKLPVEVKLAENGERIVLSGSGIIDRTQFGMTPDATEGNEVEFTFSVQLK